MGTPDNIKDNFVGTFKQLPVEDQLMISYIMDNGDELMPLMLKLDKEDERYYDRVKFLTLAHRNGITVDVLEGELV